MVSLRRVPIMAVGALLLLTGGGVLCASSPQGRDRYIATSGVDSGSCTNPASPCRTFNYVNSRSASGDVVHVLPGTYNLTASTCIVTNTSGVTWQSDAHGAATINGGGHCLYMWHNSGNSGYVKIFGFQFTGVQVSSRLNSFGVLLEGSQGNFEVAYNTFHDFGTSSAHNNFGAALSPAPYGNGNYTGRTCSVHDNLFRNIAPGGSFLHNGYSLYAIGSNNKVSNSYYGIYAEDGNRYTLSSNSTFDNNLTFNNAIDWRYKRDGKNLNLLTSFRTANNISGDPLYASPGTGCYVLRRSSPAAGRGLHVGYTPATDLNSSVRPMHPSLGATVQIRSRCIAD